MTDRDPTPLAPTCPLCATRDRVKREGSSWLCGSCWTLFTGGQGEWELERNRRERRGNTYTPGERPRLEVDA